MLFHPLENQMDSDLKKLLYQTLIGIFGIVILIIFLGHFVKGPISYLSGLFVDTFGILGVGFGILLSDSLPAFMIPDTFLIFAIAGNLEDMPVIAFASIGSLIGGSLSYAQGRYVFPRIHSFQKFIHSHDGKLKPYIEKYGMLAVVLAASTPLPYSWMAMLSGSLRMPYPKFMIGSLMRIPRFIIYYYAIKMGWLQNTI